MGRIADPMVPAARLKPPFRPPVLPPQLPFPVGDPRLDAKAQVVRRTEAMQVIRHEQVIANQPPGRFLPSLVNQAVNFRRGQPRRALLRVHREQDDVWFTHPKGNSGGRVFPTRLFGGWVAVHAAGFWASLDSRQACWLVAPKRRMADISSWWGETPSSPVCWRSQRERSEHPRGGRTSDRCSLRSPRCARKWARRSLAPPGKRIVAPMW